MLLKAYMLICAYEYRLEDDRTHLWCLQLKRVETLNIVIIMTLAYTFSTAVLHPSKACYCDTWLVLEPRAGFGEAEGMLGGREGCDGQMLLEPAKPSNGWKIILY